MANSQDIYSKEVIQQIVESLDGNDPALYPYLPYILQDLWEIGADPSIMLSLIREHVPVKDSKILDIGCGKGAVSIHLAREMECTVRGVDAIPEFVETAIHYAEKYQVTHKCSFETGDIRELIHGLKGFDIVILGAVGPILGNLKDTLKKITGSLKSTGFVLLDDGFLQENSQSCYNRCPARKDFFQQIEDARYEVIAEEIIEKADIRESESENMRLLSNRVDELVLKYPGKEDLFRNYLRNQEYEVYMLENELVCGTWVLRWEGEEVTSDKWQ